MNTKETIKFLREQIKGINTFLKTEGIEEEKIVELKERKKGFQLSIKEIQRLEELEVKLKNIFV